MPKALDADKRADIEAAIRAGGTCGDIARQFSVAKSTVSKVASDAGITNAFDRTKTKGASEARRADNQLRRAELISDLYVEAKALIHEKLKSPHTVHHFTKDGEFVTGQLDGPTSTDIRNYWVSIGIALDKARQLEQIDDGSADAAMGFLERLVDGIKGT